jgi:potassium-dependent mechanosensitive channel
MSITLRIGLFILFNLFFSLETYAQLHHKQQQPNQQPDAITRILDTAVFLKTDTANSKYSNSLGLKAEQAAAMRMKEYKASRIASAQHKTRQEITKIDEEVKLFLQTGIDTNGFLKKLKSSNEIFGILSDGIFIHQGTSQTQRNLSVSSVILAQLIDDLDAQKDEIDAYVTDLSDYKNKLDSLISDSVNYIFPSDSVDASKYLRRLWVMAAEVRPIDSALTTQLSVLHELQNRTYVTLSQFKIAAEKIESDKNSLSNIEARREFANIWAPMSYFRPLREIIRFSAAKEVLALKYYLPDDTGRLVVLVILIMLSKFFIRSVKKKMIAEGRLNNSHEGQLLVRYPLLSAVIVVLGPFQLFFADAPFAFNAFIWMILCVCLVVMSRGFISNYWFRFSIIIIILFAAACADNLILQASRAERWMMVGVSLSGAIYGTYILAGKHQRELKEKFIVYFIAFLVVFELISVLLNVFGRYNIAKALMVAGYVGMAMAILFLWATRLINEGLQLASDIYKGPEKESLYINFERVGKKTPVLVYALLGAGWIVVVGRNFYSFRQIAQPLGIFLSRERTIGSYSFTISGMLFFVLIAICSLLLSRIVSFFASSPGDTHSAPGGKKVGVGSWILLVRILVISLGLLLAFAASGIPLDKITIVLGALSVGIGLGLQGLVNNLVSGLVIAFERPVNVGDMIEVSGKMGIMKSIGFRSSVIALIDGPCLVVPNGDLLNQQLVNWTMGKNKKRILIPVGVAYGSDLDLVKKILNETLQKDKRIANYPEPFVVIKAFNQSSIDFQLTFFARHLNDGLELTSDVIARIDHSFKEAGIVIPFPRHDLFIRSEDELPPARIKKPGKSSPVADGS